MTGKRVPRFAVAVLAVALFFAGVAALAGPRTQQTHLGVLHDVPAATTGARTLADGTPVYLHRAGEQRIVLAAISPRSYLLVWCADAPGFIEPGSAFSFDAYGRYLFGGFSHGQFRYASQMVNGNVVVTGEIPPTPRFVSGAPSVTPPPVDRMSCFESEGDVGGLYHPVADDPVDVAALRFDGRWHAVRGLLDFSGPTPRLCASDVAVADQCPAHGRGVVPVASTYGLRSPIVDEMPSGGFDGAFVVRAGPGRVLHDVAIIQRFDSAAAGYSTASYSTRYIEPASEPGSSIPVHRYVVGEVAGFSTEPGGYRIDFVSATTAEEMTSDLPSVGDGEPAPASWHVSDAIDLAGVYDETGAEFLVSPQELMERAQDERLVVAGRVADDEERTELDLLHIRRRVKP